MIGLRTLRTARRIPADQLGERARTLVRRRIYALAPRRPIARARSVARGSEPRAPLPRFSDAWIAPDGDAPSRARAARVRDGWFDFLSQPADFRGGVDWDARGRSPLWRYQLEYLAPLVDLCRAGDAETAARLVAGWSGRRARAWDPVAWHPYPVSMRLTNLCTAAGTAGGFAALGDGAADLAAVHAAHLAEHLEHDVRGNHLLENLFALLVFARHFDGALAARCEAVARDGLAREVPAQVLDDGGHFELSPMYHAHVLHRLLGVAELLGTGDAFVAGVVAPAVARMRAFLAGILCPDGEIPLVGDSVRGFAPPANALLGDVRPSPRDGVTSFAATGLHVLRTPRLWAVFDAGAVCPDALPAHGQADTLTVEVWCDGACVVGDPGVHDYTGPERAWGRSSRAHSTLTVDDADTSEVYASFRVGGRAHVDFVQADAHQVTAAMTPWRGGARLTRIVRIDAEGPSLRITDDGLGAAGSAVRSRLHLAPGVRIVSESPDRREVGVATARGGVTIRAAHPLRREAGRASRAFGVIEPTTLLVQDLPREGRRTDVHGEFVLEPRS